MTDLDEDTLTMLAKCEVSRCITGHKRIPKKIEQVAYPPILPAKRHGLLVRLETMGLVSFENGWHTTSKGTKTLKQLLKEKK